MTSGSFRGGHPRLTLLLPGQLRPVEIEFIVDTGFNGDLSVPSEIARQLESNEARPTYNEMADGSFYKAVVLSLFLDNEIVSRVVEVLVMPGRTLLGVALLAEWGLHVDVTEGGDVVIEPL